MQGETLIPFINVSITAASIPAYAEKHFEDKIRQEGFSTEKDSGGIYISELTRIAMLGYSLGIHLMNNHQLSGTSTVEKNESVLLSDNSDSLPKKPNNQVTHFPAIRGRVSEAKAESPADRCPTIIPRIYNKRTYQTKSDAMKRATLICHSHVIPMWIHPAAGETGWHISSHGFDITRRPDVLVTENEINKKQVMLGLPTTSGAEKLHPSVVTRIAGKGDSYTQNGQYFSRNVLLQWLREQSDPAIVLSIDIADREKRAELIQELQSEIREELGFTSFFRWITQDTIVLSISHDHTDYTPARARVRNPFWCHKAMSWPNTFVMKEVC